MREALFTAGLAASPPLLEKVQAHDQRALTAGWPKAVGNDLADTWAKRAAALSTGPSWTPDPARFGDPVAIFDSHGVPIMDLPEAFQAAWWLRRQRSLVTRRPFMASLYPLGLEINWTLSCGIFRRPTVSGGVFVHPATPAVIKWTSRVRAGCLASGDRLHRHGQLVSSSGCRCCSAPVEDDLHLLSGCPATGTADWASNLHEAWT